MISPLSKLGLGSAQFGLDQTTLVRGRAPQAEARDILDIAARAQLAVLDVDGHSAVAEAALGEVLPRPTPFRISISTVRPDRGPDYVEAEARATLRRLGVEQADAILVPCAADLFGPHGMALWNRLRALKDAGLTRKIGVSVFASDDPLGVARRFRPDIVQAPASLLDQRLLIDGTLAALAGIGIEVHLRSIFLNGLLFLPPDRAPTHLKAAASRISRARRLIAEGRSDPLQAALGFALSRVEAATVLVGVTSAAEVSAVIAAASSPPPDLDWDEMAIDDPVALDPRAWAAA
ncbi:bifunctional regulator KidO [Phenylobacterium sp. Root77]|jgi:aryl-alcohol dehydrogenase-like predicted oxidoreductase|uniref:bifunctional regulator KidO n=1 Tax=unclassified Phenylobacterium TaxID=2640670 RepID=UPI0006FDCEBB|nr:MULTISPECIES: bifunctional regulator KidO [unclassified Phenylobacterium]KQW69447.1 bifunctional regulator KidO [Phenylobacterium sp. Root1277]KQW95187.1 bifunctional regulator KidO [Phenylobacterium sp. Root1290]KRC40978.1 bifunctional regulator KidO [Phenylobacterium sp. Root77]